MPDSLGPDFVGGASTEERSLEQLAELRELLLRQDRHELAEIRHRLDTLKLTPDEVAELLPEAIALRGGGDPQLARALGPTVDDAIAQSFQQDPEQITNAIFPILGPAIRKAIAEAFSGFVASLNRAIEHSFSWNGLKWRFEALRSGVPYTQIVLKHALVYSVEHVFLIHSETGILLAEATAPDRDSPDGDLISGMLTAIKDFVNDSFHADVTHGTRKIEVGDHNVLAEAGPRASLGAVVRGEPPPELRTYLQDTLATIHLSFTRELSVFTGDTEPFEPAVPMLEGCLQTVLATDRPRERRVKRMVAWGIAGVMVVVLIALAGRSTLAWRAAQRMLESQPGIVIVNADRGLEGWSLSGLRDVDAADPMMLLAGVGVDTNRVRAEWEPYISSDREVIAARAVRTLRPPGSVSLAVTGDTLVFTGTAGFDWAEPAVARALSISGISAVDRNRLEAQLPTQLAALQRRVESHRVLFALGASEITGDGRDSLQAISASLSMLRDAAHARGYAVALNVVGRADTTGIAEANQLLSRNRAEVLRARLVALGALDAATSIRGVGTSDPLAAADPADRARVNRSGAIEVTLRPSPRDAGIR